MSRGGRVVLWRALTSLPSAAGPAGGNPLSIVMVTSESHPFARSGGLAEVCTALPRALARQGHDVTVILPRYRGIDVTGLDRLDLRFALGSGEVAPAVFERSLDSGVRMAFVEAGPLFDREGLYGTDHTDYPDNAWRFGLFTKAALEYVRVRGRRPSVLHAHDWQTGLVPVWQKLRYAADPVLGQVRTVFTIHNLAFQGIFPVGTAAALGLPAEARGIEGMEYWGAVSFLKGGINYSDVVSTVSPTYAREALTPEFGFGMDGVLRRRGGAFVGILNGVDTDRWDPGSDPFLPVTYGAASVEAGKAAAKQELLAAAGLPADGAALARPLIGLLSRLTDQKGFDLLDQAAPVLMQMDASWVLLGNGEERYERSWQAMASARPERVCAVIGFDERLAHLITAGSDLFLMPSKFEPCGLNQLHSLRYGTVPVVRATGGLADTVIDVESADGTGVVFADYTASALVDAVRRALALSRDARSWRAVRHRGMQQNHSWDVSAREYVKVYGMPPDGGGRRRPTHHGIR